MGGIAEIGSAMMARAESHANVAAQNIANLTTPGYKAVRQFDIMVSAADRIDFEAPAIDAQDWSAGKLRSTGEPFDLAIAGKGFFVVRSGDGVFYTRDGQFHRDADGRVVTADGLALQSTGGDMRVSTADVRIARDGTITDGGRDIGALMVTDFADPSVLQNVGNDRFAATGSAGTNVASPVIEQGMLETSNASNGTEMIALMSALRSAESGQKLIQAYDEMIGQALTAFGQAR